MTLRTWLHRRHPILRTAAIIGGLLLLFVGVDLFLLLRPAQVRSHVLSILARVFRTRVEVRAAWFKPAQGFHVEGLRVMNFDGRTPFVEVEDVRIVPSYWPVGVREVVVRGVRVHLARGADGVWNIDQALRPDVDLSSLGGGGGGPSILRSIRVEDVEVALRDDLVLVPGTYASFRDVSLWLANQSDAGTEFRGQLQDPRYGSPTFTLAFPTGGGFALDLAFDRFLVTPAVRRVLPAKAQELFDLLKPGGVVTGEIHVRPSNTIRAIPDITGALTVVSGSCQIEPFPYPCRNVQGTIRFEPGRVVIDHARGGVGLARYEANGVVDLGRDTGVEMLDLQISYQDVPVDDTVGLSLPPEVSEVFWALAPHGGRGSGRTHVWGALVRELPIYWETDVDFQGTEASFREFPVPVTDLSGHLRVEGESLTLTGVTGRVGSGTLTAEVHVDAQTIDVRVDGTGIEPTPEVIGSLPGDLPEIVGSFHPSGPVDVRIRISGAEPENYRRPDIRVDVLPRALHVAFDEFPYPLEVTGRISTDVERGEIAIDCRGRRGDIGVLATGAVRLHPPEEGGGLRSLDLRLTAPAVPLDQTLRFSLPPDVREIYDDLSPQGAVAMKEIAITQAEGEDEIHVAGTIRPLGVACTYVDRPLPIERVGGTIRFADDAVDIDVTGRVVIGEAADGDRASGPPIRIVGRSRTEPSPGGGETSDLSLVIGVAGLPLVPEIEVVLDDDIREIWRSFHFTGEADARVSVHQVGRSDAPEGTEEPVEVGVDATLRNATICHDLFPYPLQGLSGRVSVEPSGTVRFRDVRGQGANAREVTGYGAFEGPKGAETLTLHVEAEDLVIDEAFRAALPTDWQEPFGEAEIVGNADLVVNLLYDLATEDMYWNGEVALDGAGLTAGIRLEPIVGRISAFGHTPDEGATTMRGVVELDRAEWKGQVVESLSATLDLADERLDLLNVHGRAYDGFLTGEFYHYFSAPHFFYGDLRLEGCRAGPLAQSLFGTEGDTGGDLWGSLIFAGEAGPAPRMQGEAEFHITDARLMELPVFLGIFALLQGEPPSEAVFREVHIDLNFLDQEMEVERCVVDSPAIYLEGGGRASYDGFVDLDLAVQIGGEGGIGFSQIPLFGDIWDLFRNNLLYAINVRGPLDGPPAVTFLPVPFLSDLIMRILRLRSDELEESPGPGPATPR